MQEISRNRSLDRAPDDPTGRITVSVPYDGDRYFTRDAVRDVEQHLKCGEQVLITSRNPGWDNLATPVPLDLFARAESTALLRHRIPQLTDTEADSLADALGDLPLAVDQTAVYLTETGIPADDYRDLLEERAELMDQGLSATYRIGFELAACGTNPSFGGFPR